MGYIKKLKIEGYKKFRNFEIEFNEHTNIIVGANEAGKSTILEAIDLIINQRYRTAEKTVIWDMLNIENIKFFEANPTIDNLPSIAMEIDFEFDDGEKIYKDYWGANNIELEPKYGILFECKFNTESYGEALISEIESGSIPVEYYELVWSWYSLKTYNVYTKKYNAITINTDKIDANSSYNYYNKTVFKNKYEGKVIMATKNSFNNNINSAFENIKLDRLNDTQKFGINKRKVVLESIISIFDNDVLLENKGSGKENLIKTRIALDRENNNIDTVLIEEPENHLSHEYLLKILCEIESKENIGQLIITTHNDLITSRLGLSNVIWISDNKAMSLKNIEEGTSKFFMKMGSNNLLHFLLSNKVILVEGPTEYLLLPSIYKNEIGHSIEEDGISIISSGGLSYKRYFKIAEKLDKKVAVITDNDGKESNLDFMKNFNNGKIKEKTKNQKKGKSVIVYSNPKHKIFMDSDILEWTWEVCFYNLNKKYFRELIEIEPSSDYSSRNVFLNSKNEVKIREKSYKELGEPHLGKMLNDKVESAYSMISEGLDELVIAQYVKDALLWISE